MIDMSILIALFLAICVVAAVTITVGSYKERQNVNKQQAGISWLQLLAKLLTLMQQHRGLTTGYIGGDSSLKPRIDDLQRAINNQIKQVEQQGDWAKSNDGWIGINDHWKRLSGYYKDHSKDYNFTQHSSLIKSLLYLIEDCAEQHHLQELQCAKKQPASILWQQLLNAGEYVGQARAIGTGIAATGASSSVERIKLNYLKQQLEAFLLKNPMPELNPFIEQLLESISNHILIAKPDLTADQYFKLATAALDKIIENFTLRLNELRT
jgi:hypothetical protein